MAEDKFDIFRKAFDDELKLNGDAWRVLRPITLIDLIKLDFIHFQKNNSRQNLVDIFNNSMKVKLLSRVSAIEIDGSPKEYFSSFNKDNDLILKEYDSIISIQSAQVKDYGSSTIYDLNSKILYLKVINDLRIDSYTEEVFDEILCIVYNLF